MSTIIFTHFNSEKFKIHIFKEKESKEKELKVAIKEIENNTSLKIEIFKLFNNSSRSNIIDDDQYKLHLAFDSFTILPETERKKNIEKIKNTTIKEIFTLLDQIKTIDEDVSKIYRECENFVQHYRDASAADQINLVYVFISLAYEGILSSQSTFIHMEEEKFIRILLERTIFSSGCDELFQIVGIQEISTILSYIENELDSNNIDKPIKNMLLTNGKSFYYDAPKFTESLLRLVRESESFINDQEEKDYILRFDNDVESQSNGLKILTKEIEKFTDPIIFFSGSYDYHDKKTEKDRYYLDDFAVRFQFLIRPYEKLEKKDSKISEYYNWRWSKTDPEKDKFVLKNNLSKDEYAICPDEINKFLKSLNIMFHDYGTGFPSPVKLFEDIASAGNIEDIINQYKINSDILINNFPISGAGLYISYEAIKILPPLTNAEKMTFIDDAIKMALHKKININCKTGRIETDFKQDRFILDGKILNKENGYLSAKNIIWALNNYISILLRGILGYNLSKYYIGDILCEKTFNFAEHQFLIKEKEMKEFLMINLEMIFTLWHQLFVENGSGYPINTFLEVQAFNEKYQNALINDVIISFKNYLDIKYILWPRVVEIMDYNSIKTNSDFKWLMKTPFKG